MEPTFLSERERRDRMLDAYYDQLDGHIPFRSALEGLAREVTDTLGRSPGRDDAGQRHPDDEDRPPGPAFPLLEAFAQTWHLPTDVGLLDVWDSLCDGPRNVTGTQGAPEGGRRHLLRVGDRPFPGVTLTAAELAVVTPEHMEPTGWRRAGADQAAGPGEDRPGSPAEDWSDLLRYDPTGIVGDITRRSGVRRGRKKVPAAERDTDVVVANEERLHTQGFARPGPRRRPEDIEMGARYLFKRVVLRMTFAAIAHEVPWSNAKVDEFAVRMTVTRWAKELAVPLPRRGQARD